MKSLNLLINLVGREKSYEQTRKGRYTLESIVSRLCLVSLICLCMLTVGVGQMWGGTYTYDFSTVTNKWYSNSTLTTQAGTGSGNNYTTVYYTDGTTWTAGGASHYFNSGYYLLGKTNAYLDLPVYPGEKITQVKIHGSNSHSTSVSVNIYTSGGKTASTAQTWSTKNIDHTYAITSKYQTSALRVQVTNNYNTQFTQIVITTEASGGDCNAIDVTGGSAVILPAGSTSYSGGDWENAGAPVEYPGSTTEFAIGTGPYCVTLTNAADYDKNSNGLQFHASDGVLLLEDITSNYGVDVEILISSGSGFDIALTGASTLSNQSAGTITISTTSTSADLTISKTTSGAGYVKYIKVTPKAASCANTVTVSDGGSSTHGSITSITTSPVATCSATAADRQVSIVVTPSNGYTAPENLSVGTKTGTVTSTKVSRTDNLNGTFTFVYRYNQNDNGTISYNAACVAKTYTISLNDQTPTTAASPSSITATYDSNTGLTGTVVTTLPTKTAYTFGGYYTETGGSGTQIIAADGTVVASAGGGSTYTDASRNWKYANDLVVYAYWIAKSLTNYRTTCGLDITVEGNVWLTSYNNVQVYTTEESANLITITCTDFGTANRLGVQYLLNGSPVTKTSSPFRLHFYDLAGKTNYNLADGGGSAGGYDYFALSDADKTAIASGQTFAISYKPKPGSGDDVYDQEHTYTLRIAALDGSTDLGHKDLTLHGRALPQKFVIASKVGDQWYALPNTILDNDRTIEPIKITVDNTTTPTRATNAPNTTAYQGTGRYASGTNRYGIRLADPSGHWLQVSSSSGTNYVWVSGTGSSTCQDWNLSSTDFGAYTLTVPSSGAGDKKMGIKSGNMGYYASPDDPSQQIYLLPADFYTEAEAQILKWKANSVIVMYTGTETSSTTKVGSNSASSAQTLSSQKLTHGIYELTTGQALTSNAGQTLALTFGSTKKEYDIPLIISGSTTASANGGDVVILSGGTFTAAATKYSFRNVYVYGGGKLAIPSGTSLGTSDIILRAGGISTNGSGGSATYEYVYPQFSLIGTLTNSSGKFRYEYVTDYSHWYHLCLPFDATLSTITYPQEYYGNNVTASNKGSWVIKRYDGATRADGDYDAWVDIESESATEVTAGHGYIYWGAPKKVTISGDKQRQAWGIQRMTMTKAASTATTAEANNKTVTGLEAYSGTGQVNDQGWNLVGNPYMVNLSGLSSTSLQTGKLVHEEVGGQWTGRWESNGDGMRYITQPSEHFDTYEAVKVTSATVTLTAGKAFFVQLAGDATALQFEASKRVNMPSLYRQNSVDVETGIVMSNSTYNDKVEFWIKDGKTAEYEVNADYPKTMNGTNFNIYGVHSHGNLSWVAIGPEIAEGSMPIGYQVPGEGDYTLSLLEPAASELESLLVTDHGVEPNVTVDLVEQDYVFHVNQAETNDARFTVSIELKDETPEDPENPGTGVDENKDIERPIKFIYQDKLYILRNGVIYDATGRRVSEINK